jgi:hypothetical protein
VEKVSFELVGAAGKQVPHRAFSPIRNDKEFEDGLSSPVWKWRKFWVGELFLHRLNVTVDTAIL